MELTHAGAGVVELLSEGRASGAAVLAVAS